MEPGTHARHLRNNPTDAEAALWRALSARKLGGVRFNRQVRIRPTNYICDLVARTPKLVIEIDGGQHAMQAEYDAGRTRYLEFRGYRVIRFWNNDVLGNLEGVVAEIERVLAERPSPSPSRKREGSGKSERSPSSLPSRGAGGAGERPDNPGDQPCP
jgi:very-short-patch-repair endonuclease